MGSMVRRVAACLAVGGLAVLFSVGATAQDEKKKDDKKKDDKKPLTTKQVMGKMNGKKGLPAKTNEAAAAGKWEDAVKSAKEAKAVGEALGKNQPKKGDKESWEKLTKEYAEKAKELLEAAEKKDAMEVKKLSEVWTKNQNCKTCHDSHR
jgi:cytochrome c556